MFQFYKTPFSTKITNFTKSVVLEPNFTQNFRSKVSNLAKIQFVRPYFFQKFSSLSPYFFQKISSLSPIFGANTFFKPPFAVLRATHLCQHESRVPPPPRVQYVLARGIPVIWGLSWHQPITGISVCEKLAVNRVRNSHI